MTSYTVLGQRPDVLAVPLSIEDDRAPEPVASTEVVKAWEPLGEFEADSPRAAIEKFIAGQEEEPPYAWYVAPAARYWVIEQAPEVKTERKVTWGSDS